MNKKKAKLGLATFGSAILTATSVATPLLVTSCSQNKTTTYKLGDEYDKEFGVDEATYKALKTTFWSKLETDLRKNPLTDDDEYITRTKKNVYRTFNAIEQQGNLSYTAMSNAVIDYAARTYGYKLCRNKTANWHDVEKIFDGMEKSFDIYMEHAGLDPEQAQAIKNDAKNEFTKFIEDPVTGLKAKYADPLSGLIEAKAFLFVCFADINSEIGLAAAANRLSQFMQDYTITFNEESKINRLDQIENKLEAYDEELQKTVTFKIGEDITPFMTTIFNVVRNRDNHVLQASEYNRHMLPGYTIRPFLKNISRDPYANKYTLNIDWQCVKTNYEVKYPERVEQTTAHIYNADRARALSSIDNVDAKNLTLNDLFPKDSIETVSYSILLTPEAQKQALYDAYFNPNYLSNNFSTNYLDFKWDKTIDEKDPKTDYSPFFRGEKLNNEESTNSSTTTEIHEIKANDLAESGLMVATKTKGSTNEDVKYQRLDDFIIVQGQMSADKRINNDGVSDLLDKFFTNCCLTSRVELTNIDTDAHEAKHTLYAKYINTDDIEKSCYQYNSTPIETNGFPIGTGSYYFLTTRYNQLREYTALFAENKFGEEHDQLKFEMGLTGSLFGLTFILQALCLTGAILTPTKAIWYWSIIITALLSLGFQAASLGIFIKYKWNISEKYDKNVNKFRKRKECKDLLDMLDSDADRFYLLKSNANREIDGQTYQNQYVEFAKKPWTDVKEIIDRYQNIYTDPVYKAFEKASLKSGIDSEEYEEAMKKWEWGHRYCNETISFDAASLALDIANIVLMAKAPEVLPSGLTKKEVAEFNSAAKMKDIEMTKDIQQSNKVATEMKDAFSKEPIKHVNGELPFRKEGKISSDELSWVNKVGETKSPLGPTKDPRVVQTDMCFCELYGLKETKFLKNNEDLVQKYGSNCWKFWKRKYGDPATGRNSFKNFLKLSTTISKDGKPGVKLGPETIALNFSKRVQEGGDIYTYNKTLVQNLRGMDYENKIPADFLSALEQSTDPEKTMSLLDQLVDDIIPNNFELSSISNFLVKNVEESIGDAMFGFFVLGPMFNSFCRVMMDIRDSYQTVIKLINVAS